MNRRELLQSAGAALVSPAVAALSAPGQRNDPSSDDRSAWVGMMRRLADPVLNNLPLSARAIPDALLADRRRSRNGSPRG
jgi:hypothetical protein